MKWCDLCEGDTIVGVNEYRIGYVFVMLDDWMGLDLQTGDVSRVRSDSDEIDGWEVFRPD